jgi:hypothetical protein
MAAGYALDARRRTRKRSRWPLTRVPHPASSTFEARSRPGPRPGSRPAAGLVQRSSSAVVAEAAKHEVLHHRIVADDHQDSPPCEPFSRMKSRYPVGVGAVELVGEARSRCRGVRDGRATALPGFPVRAARRSRVTRSGHCRRLGAHWRGRWRRRPPRPQASSGRSKSLHAGLGPGGACMPKQIEAHR